jgi:hypothetical protein
MKKTVLLLKLEAWLHDTGCTKLEGWCWDCTGGKYCDCNAHRGQVPRSRVTGRGNREAHACVIRRADQVSSVSSGALCSCNCIPLRCPITRQSDTPLITSTSRCLSLTCMSLRHAGNHSPHFVLHKMCTQQRVYITWLQPTTQLCMTFNYKDNKLY